MPDRFIKDFSGSSIKILAPAKINLFLNVRSKLPSGLHEIESLVVFSDVCDEINIIKSSKTSINFNGIMGKDLPSYKNNIILKAINFIKSNFKIKSHVSILLRKNIPVSAGLGGGSSDAASVIIGLCKLWNINIDNINIDQIVEEIGADVPVCLKRSPALVNGIGEKVDTIKSLPSMNALLINPKIALSTIEVFDQFDKLNSFSIDVKSNNQKLDLDNLAYLNNDLEDAAMALVPAIKEVLNNLKKANGCKFARMSGSGATCFGIFDKKENLFDAEKVFSKNLDWWVKPTKIFSS
tara:strand:+ start:300 stop:1184 length:885 start_codon:yes stop_codon:yes gene_type:complete